MAIPYLSIISPTGQAGTLSRNELLWRYNCASSGIMRYSIQSHVEVVYYLNAQYFLKECVETYLCDLSSWFVKQGREVLIGVRLGIKTNPQIINADYPNF